MVVLRRSSGMVRIQKKFEDITTLDELWGYHVLIRMGRLDCEDSEYQVRVTIVTRIPGDGRTKEIGRESFIFPVKELLPKSEEAYVLRFGRVKLDRDVHATVDVRVDVLGDKPHSGLVLYTHCFC